MATAKLSRKMTKTMLECLDDALQINEMYVDDNGVPVTASIAEIGVALLIEEAMPFNEETGKREIGDKKLLVEMMHMTKKEEEDSSGLGAALENLVGVLAARDVHLIDVNKIALDAEVINE